MKLQFGAPQPGPRALETLLDDATARDIVTARRACLLSILWRQRGLARPALMRRVEAELGRGCFGEKAWEDTFQRDMKAVKRALRAAGHELTYSRTKGSEGYVLRGEPRLHPQVQAAIHGALAEIDPRQIRVYARLTPAQRFQQGAAISTLAREAKQAQGT
ncbi:MAG: hypothetical protein EPO32_06675 [Anaerolineae bacterium]|nr:MAG: hypothetical protein EPO32_06675 [Anaerolineae bacterium]